MTRSPAWPASVGLPAASLAALFLVVPRTVHAQTPPDAPVIREPSLTGPLVHPADVHMVTDPMSDPDPGDTHACTDWELWLDPAVDPDERIWSSLCIGGIEKVHVHLGDGTFEGSLASVTELLADTTYYLRARHRDGTGLWSDYSVRPFRTARADRVFPLEVEDVAAAPVPSWTAGGVEVELPSGGTAGFLRLQSVGAQILLQLTGSASPGNSIQNPPALAGHEAIKIVVSGGTSALDVGLSELRFRQEDGSDVTLYFPEIHLTANQTAMYWISTNGSSYRALAAHTEPNFSVPFRGPPVPWRGVQDGFRIDLVATDLRMPVKIAIPPAPGPNPGDPVLYVAELYGTIQVVSRDGSMSVYATDLLNFDPSGSFPGTGEQGLGGLVVEPVTGDLFLGLLYDAAPPSGPHYAKVVRLHSNDGGLTAATQTTVLDMAGDPLGASHYVGSLSLGEDGLLYVHMGDGHSVAAAADLNYFRGKILRLNLDGSAPADNPFYDAGDGIGPADYVYAYRFRNPFGGAWRESDGELYEAENGPETNDRLARVLPGLSYGWDGSSASMTTNAIYNWDPPHAPCDIAFVRSDLHGGSGFPPARYDHAYVTESGPTYGTGPGPRGKRIVEFVLDPDAQLVEGPLTLVEYDGFGKATACALAAGPGGLYFSDLYKDWNATTPTDPGANVLRVSWAGVADFATEDGTGPAPHAAHFSDLSDVPGATSWLWDFGDGDSSTAVSPLHVYDAEGEYTVRLEVTGSNGTVWRQRNRYIHVTESVVAVPPAPLPGPALSLVAASPQSAGSAVRLAFRVPRAGRARLTLHDLRGREVARPFDGGVAVGAAPEVTVPAGTLAPGIYFATLRFEDETAHLRVAIVR